ncbi:hypothetical protein GGD83_002993 [Rhodoblastus sphagnicola]|nr:hypothetical protein [Rhodoblastus sphagnicola]
MGHVVPGQRILLDVGEGRDLAKRFLNIVRSRIGEPGKPLVGALQFFRIFADRPFGLPPRADIDHERHDARSVWRFERGQTNFDGKFRPIRPNGVEIAPHPHLPLARRFGESGAVSEMILSQSCRYERLDGRADHFIALVIEHPFAFGVRQADQTARTDHDHRGGTGFDRQAKNILGRRRFARAILLCIRHFPAFARFWRRNAVSLNLNGFVCLHRIRMQTP